MIEETLTTYYCVNDKWLMTDWWQTDDRLKSKDRAQYQTIRISLATEKKKKELYLRTALIDLTSRHHAHVNVRLNCVFRELNCVFREPAPATPDTFQPLLTHKAVTRQGPRKCNTLLMVAMKWLLKSQSRHDSWRQSWEQDTKRSC